MIVIVGVCWWKSQSAQMRGTEDEDEWTSDYADEPPSKQKFEVEWVRECEYSEVIKLMNLLLLKQYGFNGSTQ